MIDQGFKLQASGFKFETQKHKAKCDLIQALLCDQANTDANIAPSTPNLQSAYGLIEANARGTLFSKRMDEEQPTFKVVDRRPFNPDGTPRDVPPEEKTETAQQADSSILAAAEPQPKAGPPTESQPEEPARSRDTTSREPRTRPPATGQRAESERSHPGGDPLDDPASFLSLIMSLASNAAASLGMMPHPVTGESGVDLKTAKHWIDVLGMLEHKSRGNLNPQEAQVLEGLLADLRMQYVSLGSSPTPPPSKFSASDITGGK